MMDSLELTLCQMQGHLFEMSAESGYDSEAFIKGFMKSAVAADLDKPFHHMQWAGEAYIIERFAEENPEAVKTGPVLDGETLFWTGYVYRAWHFFTGENSKQIYRQAPIAAMKSVYLMYHTMSVEMAIERLKETYEKTKRQI